MFNNIDYDNIIAKATEIIKITDRQKFIDIIKYALQKISDNDICLSNPEIIISEGTIPEQINVYSSNPLIVANKLSNALFENGSETVFLKTVIPNQELELYILNRNLINFYRFPIIKSVNTQQLFAPAEVKINEMNFKLMDPLIELIEIYHKLYIPWPDKWDTSQLIEEKLYQLYRNIHDNKDEKTGGAGDFLFNIRQSIYDQMQTIDFGLLIGHWAYHLLYPNTSYYKYEKIQVLANENLAPIDICKKLNKILRSDLTISFQTEKVQIPYDYWLERTTYYITHDNKKNAIMDSFNTLNYEIVPYITTKNNIRIAHPFTLCRFFLIDRFILVILEKMKILKADIKIKNILHIVDILRTVAYKTERTDYIGIYTDSHQEKKKLVKSQDQKFIPYIPYQYKQKIGSLREIK